MARSFLNRPNLVTTEGSLDLLRKSIQESVRFDAYGDQDVFPAIVLTPAKAATITEGATHGAATKFAVGQQAEGVNFIYKVRILGDNSPHQYLPDPSDPSFGTSEAAKAAGQDFKESIVSLHMTVALVAAGDLTGIPTAGDIVDVRLRRNGADGALNMQFGEMVHKSGGQGMGGSNFNGGAGFSVVGNFNFMRGAGEYYKCKGNAAKCGAKDDPSFAKCRGSNYPSLEKRPTQFKTYSKDQVLAAIRGSGHTTAVQQIMWTFITKEQPRFNFPANNPAGIQLDNKGNGFRGTGQADFDYQTCFRDSGGDQRIFAGFDDLSRGMRIYGKIIQGKMSVFKKLDGATNIDNGEILVWNYYHSWNTAFSKTELIELKASGQVIRSGKVYKKDWAGTSALFAKSLAAYNQGNTEELGTSEVDLYGTSDA